MLFSLTAIVPAILLSAVIAGIGFPFLLRFACIAVGRYLRFKTRARRELIVERARSEARDTSAEKRPRSSGGDDDEWERVESHAAGTAANGGTANADWGGLIGFFHPFCNAGGGGERVLWAAIRATQDRWPQAICLVYTGDHDADKSAILQRVEDRFKIALDPPRVAFVYLSTRRYVLSATWPRFTLLGQSLGSLVLAYEALSLLTPDVVVDTMGYAFALAFCKALLPSVPTAAYVHYPTISTDMLGSLEADGQGVNAGQGVGVRGWVKKRYWRLFARLYGWTGGTVDVVMTNSSWTAGHIRDLWGPHRARRRHGGTGDDIAVVFPPCPVHEITAAISFDAAAARRRQLLYIAQFRPEKNHSLVLDAFAHLLAHYPPSPQQSPAHAARPVAGRAAAPPPSDDEKPTLVLLGSVRGPDDATRVYQLRLLAHELGVRDHVEFVLDAPWSQVVAFLASAWVGINAMWNEHFGIGVVEYQAAGLIGVVNRSGGPWRDIVVDAGDGPTGFHASTATEYAAAFREALSLTADEAQTMRVRARHSAERFTGEEFARRWVGKMDELIRMAGARPT